MRLAHLEPEGILACCGKRIARTEVLISRYSTSQTCQGRSRPARIVADSMVLCPTLCDTIRFMKNDSGTPSARIEPWASVEEVTAHLGVARDTIYRWIEAKRMPAHRIGRLWKFKLSEVDSWVRSGGADEIVEQKADPPQGADQ